MSEFLRRTERLYILQVILSDSASPHKLFLKTEPKGVQVPEWTCWMQLVRWPSLGWVWHLLTQPKIKQAYALDGATGKLPGFSLMVGTVLGSHCASPIRGADISQQFGKLWRTENVLWVLKCFCVQGRKPPVTSRREVRQLWGGELGKAVHVASPGRWVSLSLVTRLTPLGTLSQNLALLLHLKAV